MTRDPILQRLIGDYREVALRSGQILRVPELNPEWLDDIIADSETATEAGERIRARLDLEEGR